MWRMIGPALLFSGAAIGTSHLFQSTRAGAMYGLGLVLVIALACLLKYPSFRFGVDYGHSMRRSLVAGYGELGPWAPLAFSTVFLVLPVIFAALGSATAGIVVAIFEVDAGIPSIALTVLVLSTAILLVGGYSWLDKINRLLVLFLLASTLITTVVVLPNVEWGTIAESGWAVDPKGLLFVIALAGFMPNPLDVSVTQSMWTAEAANQLDESSPVSIRQTRAAFLSGYAITGILAVCFCIIGAGVMHSSGTVPEQSAPGLARQVIGLYRSAIGDTAASIAAVAALSVMLTTILAGLDGVGRNIAATWQVVSGRGDEHVFQLAYRLAIPLVVLAAALVMFQFTDSFTAMLDLATSFALIAAPIIALLNHLVVTRCQMPQDCRPSRAIRILNLTAISVMALLAIAFFIL